MDGKQDYFLYADGNQDGLILIENQMVSFSWESRSFYINGKPGDFISMGRKQEDFIMMKKMMILYQWQTK